MLNRRHAVNTDSCLNETVVPNHAILNDLLAKSMAAKQKISPSIRKLEKELILGL